MRDVQADDPVMRVAAFLWMLHTAGMTADEAFTVSVDVQEEMLRHGGGLADLRVVEFVAKMAADLRAA